MYKSTTGPSVGSAPYNFEEVGYMPPPAPSLNGGLYTGEPFAKGAPWANTYVPADVVAYTNVNLRSAKPAPGATTQYPGQTRPGNNIQQMPGIIDYNPATGYIQAKETCSDAQNSACVYDGKYAAW